MLIENTTGNVTDTTVLDGNNELLTMVHKVEFMHEANCLPTANIHCHKPTIKAKTNGRIIWNTDNYSRVLKESLFAQLKRELT